MNKKPKEQFSRFMEKLKTILKKLDFELVMWITALLYLLTINPYESQIFTFCPFHNLGIEACPGCGLGRSISFIYHGDFLHSVNTHPLGFFALAVIIFRIIQLSVKLINKHLKERGTQWQMY